jgi:hypothetical protein
MPETLLSDSSVLLFGREVTDLELVKDAHSGSTGAIADLLKADDATIARIYSFSFQNEFFDLASPALFVVRGEGTLVDSETVEQTGLSRLAGDLAEDLRVWVLDRGDVSVRLDVMTGSLDRILLDYELAEEGLQDFVRGGGQVGKPASLSGRSRRRGRWRSDDD